MTAEDVRADVMVLCVYFVERLVFRHGLMFGALTWRRALFGLMLISTKVSDGFLYYLEVALFIYKFCSVNYEVIIPSLPPLFFFFFFFFFCYLQYWEELSIWNSDFSGHVPKADVEELQSLEMALLKLLNFQVVVPGDMYVISIIFIVDFFILLIILILKSLSSLFPPSFSPPTALQNIILPSVGFVHQKKFSLVQNSVLWTQKPFLNEKERYLGMGESL